MSAQPDRFIFDEKAQVGPGVIATLLKVDAWASSIQSDALVTPSLGSTACDVIEQLANAFVSEATGIERQLLRKSLLEAILYCVGLDTDVTAEEIISRLTRFVNRRGKAAFIQQFLSLYFFNYLLLDVSNSGQTPAVNYDMKLVERMCRRAVAAFTPEDVKDLTTAEALIHKIHSELRGLMKSAV
jgi:hypothetical protein